MKKMRYNIKRECWNKKTFNGYDDNPYWKIEIFGNWYGLTDDGKLWSLHNLLITEHTIVEIEKIIKECKLNIVLQNKTN